MIGLPLSLLVRQATFDDAGFLQRYPCWWLVWEPSTWTPPLSSADQSVVETQGQATNLRPVNGDPLCFALKRGTRLHIGRAPENEIVVSDATISRVHAELERKGELWLLRSHSSEVTRVGPEPVALNESVLLASGDALTLGAAEFSFMDALAFKAHVTSIPLNAAGVR